MVKNGKGNQMVVGRIERDLTQNEPRTDTLSQGLTHIQAGSTNQHLNTLSQRLTGTTFRLYNNSVKACHKQHGISTKPIEQRCRVKKTALHSSFYRV